MWIRDFWNRVLAKFRKEDSVSEPVMELTAQEAPEPVPERKTSDEMIIEMAQSLRWNRKRNLRRNRKRNLRRNRKRRQSRKMRLMKMKENTSKKNVRKAHLLLGAYWGFKVLTGGSIPKTTLKVLQLERRSVQKEKREARLAEAGARKSADTGETISKKRKPASAALTGTAKKPLLLKAGKKILKTARVI